MCDLCISKSAHNYNCFYMILQALGNVNLKVVPTPNVELTLILPFIFSTSILQMDSPNPVPWIFSLALTKRSNTESILSFCG